MRPTPQDPTGMRGVRKEGLIKYASRLNATLREVEAVIKRRLPLITNFVSYSPTQQDITALTEDITRVMYGVTETEDEDSAPLWWWFAKVLESAYRQGTISQTVDAARYVDVSQDALLLSRGYYDAFGVIVAGAYVVVRKNVSSLRADIIQTVLRGLNAGATRRTILQEVGQLVNNAKTKARMLVDTEVNKAYNSARLNALSMINAMTGASLKVRHISALLPTTRPHHAARHQHVYTVQEQSVWWATGANSINCHCSVVAVDGETG